MTFEERDLARMATAVENRDPHVLATVHALPPGHARILGITGPPGAGKSTLVSALADALRRQGKTLAVIAVDPSSRATGGAILGDRIRMQQLHADPGIFIRSMATRGASGGLARATADMVRLMDAAGKDYIIVETVGVGQAEIEIAGLAQITVVVLVPGLGDDVQTLKAGIMEIADVFVINKADHPGADRVEQQIEAMLGLADGGRKPAIVKTVATTGEGIDKLLEAIDAVEYRSAATTGPSAPTLDHLSIVVQSLEESIAFYQSLGFAVSHRETHRATLPAGDSYIELLSLAHVSDGLGGVGASRRGVGASRRGVGASRRGAGFSLRGASAPPNAPDSPLGVHHIALRVPNLQAALASLGAAGVQVIDDPRPGAIFVHPPSAGGVLLELIEEPKN